MKPNIEPTIIFEAKDYIVINKPSGLMVHDDGRNKTKTLCDFLVIKYPEIEKVGESLKIKDKDEKGEFIEKLIKRPGIVHRLDKETSGVMLVARTQSGFDYLKSQFKKRKINKTYRTFVYGNIREDKFEISEPIGRSKKDFRKWFAGDRARGKLRNAQTKFKVLNRSADKKTTFLEARPKTGRTHQIRVHLNHIYKPIVCDSLYAPNRLPALDFSRLALHAKKIEFINMEGKKMSFESEYPEDFKKAIKIINN